MDSPLVSGALQACIEVSSSSHFYLNDMETLKNSNFFKFLFLRKFDLILLDNCVYKIPYDNTSCIQQKYTYPSVK